MGAISKRSIIEKSPITVDVNRLEKEENKSNNINKGEYNKEKIE